MSRSYRKNPAGGIATVKPGAEKWFKRYGNKVWRSRVKKALAREEYDGLPLQREAWDVWSNPKDGKHWFGKYATAKDMRK